MSYSDPLIMMDAFTSEIPFSFKGLNKSTPSAFDASLNPFTKLSLLSVGGKR